MNRNYRVLTQQVVESGEFKLVPIRYEDRYEIMKWRNEQMYHLRQADLLTVEIQDYYFNEVVDNLFEQEKPDQILFSFLKEDSCIGYGGLVHINWLDSNAEVSFIMNTELESLNFKRYWGIYLEMICRISFTDLNFHKLYVYAFDVRIHLYEVLKENDFFLDARLKDHCKIDKEYRDVVIYSKLNAL